MSTGGEAPTGKGEAVGCVVDQHYWVGSSTFGAGGV